MTDKKINNTVKHFSLLPDVLVAAQELGHRSNISELARQLGKSPVVMANKLNPDCDTHHLSLGEAVAITELADDNGIIDAWAHLRGKVLVDIPVGSTNDEELADQVMLIQSVFGQMMQTIYQARADGVIDRLEHSAIERVGTEVAQQVIGLIKSTGANIRDFPVAK